jgi:uncharacterized tellurite resistance protein B-like protein
MNIDPTLKTHFLNLYHMALSDSQIDTVELEVLYRIGEERGVLKSEIDAVVLRPDTFKFSIPNSVLERVEYLLDFARMAWADDNIAEDEKQLMIHLCKKFEFQDDNIENIIQFLFEEVKKCTPKEEILKMVSENM